MAFGGEEGRHVHRRWASYPTKTARETKRAWHSLGFAFFFRRLEVAACRTSTGLISSLGVPT